MRIMMIAVMLTLPLAACQSRAEKQGDEAQANGTGAKRSYAAAGFTAIDLRGSDDVDVRTGPFAVTAEGAPEILDRLDIRVVDGTLRVGRKEGSNWLRSDHGATIHVVMPRLTAATVAGSGDLSAARAEGDFNGSIAGSGDLAIADLHAASVDLSVAGSGDAIVGGATDKLEVSIAGSGEVDARRLSAARAEISIAGSGSVRGVVKGPASVSLLGAGDVELTGGAKCKVSSLGAGEARCN